ncbi:MAG: alpha/beta hydrolase [Alcanivorax sp.]|nr:alpha/beta hydrolase [Alcanivorax sp.]
MSASDLRLSAYGQQLAALQWPGQGEPILALHGWLDNAASFLPLAEHIRQPMVAMDFAGHGLSDHRPGQVALHLIDHVRDVMAVADALGWQRFTLMGHSMGAGVATFVAATFPERVSRLVLIEGLGPPTTAADEAPDTLRKAIADMAALPDKRKPVYCDQDDAVAARTRGFGGLSVAASRLLCERGLMTVEGGWTWRADSRLRLTSSLRLTEEQVEGFVRAIQAPVCLVVGDQGLGNSGFFSHRLAWLKNLRLETLSGRHHLHMEAPARVAGVINAFLGTTEGDQKHHDRC